MVNSKQQAVPWGFGRMLPLDNVGGATDVRYAGVDPETQTGRWVGADGRPKRAEMGKHGTSVNSYPPTQVSKDGRQDGDTGHDATQD
ncbi:putative ATP-grasp-modified RiPP [Embleya sp. NPDC059237]|uniref:putative ATP-grasp-modified RiPP n=1 Tax=Embleya sp. NPDC059237 TaxID=3346784 RepID=UPI0036A70463